MSGLQPMVSAGGLDKIIATRARRTGCTSGSGTSALHLTDGDYDS